MPHWLISNSLRSDSKGTFAPEVFQYSVGRAYSRIDVAAVLDECPDGFQGPIL
jgi:hypothetical protein